MSTTIYFDQIAEVACRNCDWFGMRDELRKDPNFLDGAECCPDCLSPDLEKDYQE